MHFLFGSDVVTMQFELMAAQTKQIRTRASDLACNASTCLYILDNIHFRLEWLVAQSHKYIIFSINMAKLKNLLYL